MERASSQKNAPISTVSSPQTDPPRVIPPQFQRQQSESILGPFFPKHSDDIALLKNPKKLLRNETVSDIVSLKKGSQNPALRRLKHEGELTRKVSGYLKELVLNIPKVNI